MTKLERFDKLFVFNNDLNQLKKNTRMDLRRPRIRTID